MNGHSTPPLIWPHGPSGSSTVGVTPLHCAQATFSLMPQEVVIWCGIDGRSLLPAWSISGVGQEWTVSLLYSTRWLLGHTTSAVSPNFCVCVCVCACARACVCSSVLSSLQEGKLDFYLKNNLKGKYFLLWFCNYPGINKTLLRFESNARPSQKKCDTWGIRTLEYEYIGAWNRLLRPLGQCAKVVEICVWHGV